MRELRARLVATPGEPKPFKVVVTRRGDLIAERPVSSEKAGEAMIADIEKLGRESRFML